MHQRFHSGSGAVPGFACGMLALLANCAAFGESRDPGGTSGSGVVAPGPWGRLEYHEIRLKPPRHYVEQTLARVDQEVVWRFPGQEPASVGELLRELGLSEAEVERLARPEGMQVREGVLEIRPPDDLVVGVRPEVRARLYRLFREISGSMTYLFPYVLGPDWREEALASRGLSPDLVALVERLAYHEEAVLTFADLPLVLRMAPDQEARLLLVKSLLGERSLAVRLKVEEGSDLRVLAAYWTGGGRNKEILPILESVLETEGVERIDLAHLLPPLARMLLFTYPNPGMAVGAAAPDCFWTAANFFHYEPSDRFLDFEAFGARLSEAYSLVSGEPRFGDIVLISDARSGELLHACNHLAGDLVFTKNGSSLNRPWVIDRLEAVVAGYRKRPELSVKFFRLKSLFDLSP